MSYLSFRLTASLTGMNMVGEALALFVGMRILGDDENLWLANKNALFLSPDLGARLFALRQFGEA